MIFKNPQMKKMYDMVFTKRNTVGWTIIELSKGNPGSYFVLVGSGHYFGPSNILELLESKDTLLKRYKPRYPGVGRNIPNSFFGSTHFHPKPGNQIGTNKKTPAIDFGKCLILNIHPPSLTTSKKVWKL